MKEKLARLQAVATLLKTHKIESQDVLLGYLRKEGFAVTQATLSRDLRVLNVGKISDGKGGYIYSMPGEDENYESSGTYIQDFLKGYISIDWSGNIVVVKTYSGHSDPVALALDSFGFDEVLGTVAGRDNTVAVFLREGVKGEDFIKKMKELMPHL